VGHVVAICAVSRFLSGFFLSLSIVRLLQEGILGKGWDSPKPARGHVLGATRKGGALMAKKEILDKLSIYIPQRKMDERPVERLIKLGEKRDRSINYLVVDAILQYLNREERKAS
jgi:hypothetical protein